MLSKHTINILNLADDSELEDFPASVGKTANGEYVLEVSFENVWQLVGCIAALFATGEVERTVSPSDLMRFSVGADGNTLLIPGSSLGATREIVISSDAELAVMLGTLARTVSESCFAKSDVKLPGWLRESVYDPGMPCDPEKLVIVNVDTGISFTGVPGKIEVIDDVYTLCVTPDQVGDIVIAALGSIVPAPQDGAEIDESHTACIRVREQEYGLVLSGAALDENDRLVFDDEWAAMQGAISIAGYLVAIFDPSAGEWVEDDEDWDEDLGW